jgi:hypothetical protein
LVAFLRFIAKSGRHRRRADASGVELNVDEESPLRELVDRIKRLDLNDEY